MQNFWPKLALYLKKTEEKRIFYTCKISMKFESRISSQNAGSLPTCRFLPRRRVPPSWGSVGNWGSCEKERREWEDSSGDIQTDNTVAEKINTIHTEQSTAATITNTTSAPCRIYMCLIQHSF